MIYLDNAATTIKKPQQVAQAMVEALSMAGNSARGANESSLCASRIIYDTRVKIAKLFGCPRFEHVAFTCNATEALNTAIGGILNEGDHVLTTELEHNSVLRPLYRLQDEKRIDLDYIPTDAYGNPEYEKIDMLVKPNTKAIICTHASNLSGNIVDLDRMSTYARKYDLLLIVDASQTAGAIPIDMSKTGIDVLCFTGHKGLFGPQGTGGICVREGLHIRPLKVGGTGVQSHSRTQPEQMPVRLEAGTLNVHGLAGLSASVDFINSVGVEAIYKREQKLTWQFYEGVCAIPGIKVYGDFRGDHAGIVSLNIRDLDSGEVSDRLMSEYGIATRSGAHCAPRMHEVFKTTQQGAVRFSFSYFTEESEIDTAIQALREIAEE